MYKPQAKYFINEVTWLHGTVCYVWLRGTVSVFKDVTYSVDVTSMFITVFTKVHKYNPS
jgi:hypothetical protein